MSASNSVHRPSIGAGFADFAGFAGFSDARAVLDILLAGIFLGEGSLWQLQSRAELAMTGAKKSNAINQSFMRLTDAHTSSME